MKNQFTNIHSNLIELCRQNNSKAQFQLYKLYYSAMFNTCLRIVNNSVQAEDIMQEAFLTAFRKINTYKQEVSFGAWLKKIVVNKSLDFLKTQKIKFETIDFDFVETEDDDQNIIENEIMVEKIKKTIFELPDKYRIILSLYLLEGYDHQEISEILKITAQTSRTQFSRAKQKLIKLIKN